MRPPAGLLGLALLLAVSACAAVPAETLGTAPRSPATAQELSKDYPVDIYVRWRASTAACTTSTPFSIATSSCPCTYDDFVPDPLRQGVSNFFRNLGEFRNGLNGALQGRGEVFGTAFGRLFVNSTIGIFGLFDLATEFGILEHREDFGQTLGWWGVRLAPISSYLSWGLRMCAMPAA